MICEQTLAHLLQVLIFASGFLVLLSNFFLEAKINGTQLVRASRKKLAIVVVPLVCRFIMIEPLKVPTRQAKLKQNFIKRKFL